MNKIKSKILILGLIASMTYLTGCFKNPMAIKSDHTPITKTSEIKITNPYESTLDDTIGTMTGNNHTGTTPEENNYIDTTMGETKKPNTDIKGTIDDTINTTTKKDYVDTTMGLNENTGTLGGNCTVNVKLYIPELAKDYTKPINDPNKSIYHIFNSDNQVSTSFNFSDKEFMDIMVYSDQDIGKISIYNPRTDEYFKAEEKIFKQLGFHIPKSNKTTDNTIDTENKKKYYTDVTMGQNKVSNTGTGNSKVTFTLVVPGYNSNRR